MLKADTIDNVPTKGLFYQWISFPLCESDSCYQPISSSNVFNDGFHCLEFITVAFVMDEYITTHPTMIESIIKVDFMEARVPTTRCTAIEFIVLEIYQSKVIMVNLDVKLHHGM